MQIVIDIPDNMQEMCRWHQDCICNLTSLEVDVLAEAVRNGIVLPKGHGRLFDADAFIKFMQTASKTRKYDELWIDNFLTVDDVFNAVIASIKNEGTSNGNALTVIEADKEVENEGG